MPTTSYNLDKRTSTDTLKGTKMKQVPKPGVKPARPSEEKAIKATLDSARRIQKEEEGEKLLMKKCGGQVSKMKKGGKVKKCKK